MDYSRLSLIVIRIPVHPWITSQWVIHDVANSYRFKRLLKWLDVRKKIKLLVSVSRSIHLQSVLVARLKAEDEFSSIFLQYIPVAHEKSRNEFWLLLNERERGREAAKMEDHGTSRMFSGKIVPGDCRCRRWNKKIGARVPLRMARRAARLWKVKTSAYGRVKGLAPVWVFHTSMHERPSIFGEAH